MGAVTKPRRERTLSEELAHLNELTVKRLKERWQILYGSEAPPDASRELHTRAVAYRLQERAFGGLKQSTRRLLERVAQDSDARASKRTISPARPTAGTTLLREWCGINYHVTVLGNGVVYRGKRYQSLSEVARAITGTRWSGPRFFGLNVRRKENNDGTH